jgi:hypothetical protein
VSGCGDYDQSQHDYGYVNRRKLDTEKARSVILLHELLERGATQLFGGADSGGGHINILT